MRKLLTMLLVLMMALSMVQAAGAETAQEIVYALANEPDGIDPSVTNNSFASNILVNVFEGLVTYDTASGALIPGEAESYEISEDGLVYTFVLRDGLKWSDGSDHTAQDYAYTVKRILTPATTAKYVNLVTDYVVGAQEYYDGVTDDFDTVGFKALDDKTIQITLKDNASHFIDILTMFTFSPVQAATVEANGDQWTNKAETYVTNGPFRVTELNMGESVVMEKNPHYYGADRVKLEKITFRYISDLGTSLMAYENGELHGMNTIPSSDYARLKAEDAGVVVSPSYGTVFYDINNAKEPFDNPLVRKALNLAVDRIAIIEDVVQTDAVPAFSYISPGYVVDGEDFIDGRDNFELSEEADPEAAQAALAEAGYPGGEGFPVLELSYYTNETVKKVVEAMAEMFETNLGISVNISNADWAIFYEDVRAGKYDVAAMGWSGDYLHPMTFMPLLKTGDESNNVFYSNPEYDALVEKGSVMTDAKAAMEVFREAEALACNEYPMLPLYYKSNMMLMHDNVTGYYVDPTNQMYLRNAFVVE